MVHGLKDQGVKVTWVISGLSLVTLVTLCVSRPLRTYN